MWDQLFLRNDTARAEAALDRCTPSTPHERQVVERFRVQVEDYRFTLGEAAPETWPGWVQRSRRVVDNARRNGDELEVALSLSFHNYVLNRVLLFPDRVADQAPAGARAAEALAAAREAMSICDRYGAHLLGDAAAMGLAGPLSAMTSSGERPAAGAAREIRRLLADALEWHSLFAAFAIASLAVTLIWPTDPRTALFVDLARARLMPFPSLLPSDHEDELGPEAVAEIRAQAATASLRSALETALHALDRAFPPPA